MVLWLTCRNQSEKRAALSFQVLQTSLRIDSDVQREMAEPVGAVIVAKISPACKSVAPHFLRQVALPDRAPTYFGSALVLLEDKGGVGVEDSKTRVSLTGKAGVNNHIQTPFYRCLVEHTVHTDEASFGSHNRDTG